jgi:peptidoglycan/LPS O-acetylase OafA/YrhL
VLLVVLYHAGVAHLTGGYVGVDVFFVISGFVITGLLLRERAGTSRTSILSFYARRSRRIIPAATVAIIATVVLSYLLLGVVGGNRSATDGIWAAIFLANFHFASIGTNYLTEFQAPSPLQNFWSLSVEEQFYVVYPTLFLLVGKARMAVSFRARLAFGLCVAIVASFAVSVLQTSSSPTVAYFSPFARAWELALGALVAAGGPWLSRLPARLAATMTWVGLGLIAVAAVAFNAHTPYPGSAVAVPVVGAALVIAGGTVASRYGAESLLRLWPFRQLGRLSYSLYLWHWPILILAAQNAGATSLPVTRNLLWLLVALGLSIITYFAIENPIRHSAPLNRNRLLSIGLGIALIAATLTVGAVERSVHAAPAAPEAASATSTKGTASAAAVASLVASAPKIHTLPANLDPPLGVSVLGWPYASACWPGPSGTSAPPCLFGDPHGTRSMVVVGDSHSQMWFYTINAIAKKAHWKLWYLSKSYCPAALLPFTKDQLGHEYTTCNTWHQFVINRINHLDPDMVVVTQEGRGPPHNAKPYSNSQWEDGTEAFFQLIRAPKAKFVIIGNIPQLPQTGPDCIARHTNDVQLCSATRSASKTPYHQAEAAAVESVGGRYIDPTPWFCSKVCTPVIGNYDVYFDHFHMMGPYALHLEGVLAQALQLPASSDSSKGSEETANPPHTKVWKPSKGAVVTGLQLLDASGSSVLYAAASNNREEQVTKVQFRLTGGGLHDALIGTGTKTEYGWVAGWRTTSVPNGRYTLHSVAYEADGLSATSPGVTITVAN